MFTKDDIELLKAQLQNCYGPYIELLVIKTSLSRPTISKFLNHKPVKAKNKSIIYKTGYDLIAKKNAEDRSLIKDLRKLANEESIEGKQVSLNLN